MNEVQIILFSWPTNDGDKLNHITIPNHLLVKAKSFLPSLHSLHKFELTKVYSLFFTWISEVYLNEPVGT